MTHKAWATDNQLHYSANNYVNVLSTLHINQTLLSISLVTNKATEDSRLHPITSRAAQNSRQMVPPPGELDQTTSPD